MGIHGDELVVSFPDVHPRATLRIHFRPVGSTDSLFVRPIDDAIAVGWTEPFVMRLRPESLGRSFGREWHYPFALHITVNGRNALTGEPSREMDRSPQNYFSSPPQGGIDGYFAGGLVHPFLPDAALARQTRMEITIVPMKGPVFDALLERRGRLGFCPDPIQGLTLSYGGPRTCEPVYEDLCSFGDWDRNRREQLTIWLAPTQSGRST